MGAQDCLAGWCSDDDWCGVACTGELLGNRWRPVLVRALLADGPHGFNDLLAVADELSSSVLSDALAALKDHDVVERTVVCEAPVRVRYSLTERGEALEPVIEAMEDWGTRYGSA